MERMYSFIYAHMEDKDDDLTKGRLLIASAEQITIHSLLYFIRRNEVKVRSDSNGSDSIKSSGRCSS